PGRLAGPHPQGLPVQDGKQLDHRKCRADVRAASTVDHVQDSQPQARAQLGELRAACGYGLRNQLSHQWGIASCTIGFLSGLLLDAKKRRTASTMESTCASEVSALIGSDSTSRQ